VDVALNVRQHRVPDGRASAGQAMRIYATLLQRTRIDKEQG